MTRTAEEILSQLIGDISRAPDDAEVWFGGWGTYSGVRDQSKLHISDVRAALTRHPSPLPEAGGWREIGSAPRVAGPVYLGWNKEWATPETIDWDETREEWCIPFLRPKAQPTHWQPLPPPPQSMDAEQKGEGE